MSFCLVVLLLDVVVFFFFFKQKTAYEMRISDWSSDVCSSDLRGVPSTERLYGCCVSVVGVHRSSLPAPVTGSSSSGAPESGSTSRIVISAVGRLEIGRESCRERVCQYV